ncbi:MAG: O-antigen ligase family protein [Salinibacter sp.]
MIQDDRWDLSSALGIARMALLGVTAVGLPLIAWPANTSYAYTKSVFAIGILTALFLLWGLELILEHQRIKAAPLIWPLTALAVAAALSLADASNPRLGLESLALVAYFAGLYLLIANSVRSDRAAMALVGCLIAAGSLVSLYAMLQYVGLLPAPPATQGPKAMIATLGNKNFVAELAAFLIPPALGLLAGLKQRTIARLLLGGGSILMASTLVLTRTEFALLAVLSALVVVSLAWMVGRHIQRLRLAGCLPALAIVVVVGVSLATAWVPFAMPSWLGTEAERSLLTRIFNWRAGVEMFFDDPFTGQGWSHYRLHFLDTKAELVKTDWGQRFDFTVSRSVQAHNDYVQVAAEAGLIGLAALAWLVGALFRGLADTLTLRDRRLALLRLGLYGGILAWTIDAAVNFPAHRPESALVLVVLAGVLHSPGLSMSQRDRCSNDEQRSRLPGIVFLLVVVLIGVPVAGLAYRDLQGDLLLETGQRHVAAGRLEVARAQLTRSADLAFEPSSAHFHLGRAYAQGGDHRRAIEALQRSLRGRVAEGTYLLLAQSHYAIGNTEQAWRYVERLLETDPHPAQKVPAYYLRAQLYRDRGEVETALAQLEHVIRLQPDLVDAHRLMARLRLEQGERGRAIDRYERSLEVAERSLARRQQSIQDRLTGEGVTEAEWHQITREIRRLERQIEAIRTKLADLKDASP